MKLVGLLLSCVLGAFAAGENVFLLGADAFPGLAPLIKNGSVLIENGKRTSTADMVRLPTATYPAGPTAVDDGVRRRTGRCP